MSEFTFSIEEGNDTPTTIDLIGRLVDEELAQDLLSQTEKVIAKGNANLIFDLNKLEYINSSGLNSLVNVLTKARSNGGDVVLCHLSEKVKSLFIVTKLNTVFTVSDSKDDAKELLINKVN